MYVILLLSVRLSLATCSYMHVFIGYNITVIILFLLVQHYYDTTIINYAEQGIKAKLQIS